jgi:hypothetical protein
MRSRLSWLLVWGVLLAALLVKSARPGGAPLAGLWERPDPISGALLAAALVPLTVMFVLILLNLDDSPPRPPSGDLERLLGRKHMGFLRPRRLRESETWVSLLAPSTNPRAGPHLTPTAPPEAYLAHLLEWKRHAAWAAHAPDRSAEGPEPPLD